MRWKIPVDANGTPLAHNHPDRLAQRGSLRNNPAPRSAADSGPQPAYTPQERPQPTFTPRYVGHDQPLDPSYTPSAPPPLGSDTLAHRGLWERAADGAAQIGGMPLPHRLQNPMYPHVSSVPYVANPDSYPHLYPR